MNKILWRRATRIEYLEETDRPLFAGSSGFDFGLCPAIRGRSDR